MLTRGGFRNKVPGSSFKTIVAGNPLKLSTFIGKKKKPIRPFISDEPPGDSHALCPFRLLLFKSKSQRVSSRITDECRPRAGGLTHCRYSAVSASGYTAGKLHAVG